MTDPLTTLGNRLVQYPVLGATEWLALVRAMRLHDVLMEMYTKVNVELIGRIQEQGRD